jgi:deferrochelatase/peroxidase EfeB
MSKVISSKNIEGITDLVVVAPIKDGFIRAYENVTYATRLRIVAEALNRVRVNAREYELITPFSDVTQRILTLLDFRVGLIDKDLFVLPPAKNQHDKWPVQSRRYLYLTATFDGAWEPYMRLIWDPLGPFLDLLFCNCEGYVTAGDHSFDEYAQWVRDNQMDSAIFYATTGLTVRDQIYLGRLEQLQRSRPAAQSDFEIARLTMPDPKQAATAERLKALADLAAKDPTQYRNIHELALQALTVLYRLADFYPPEWLIKQPDLSEGRYLARVATDLLQGWEDLIPTSGPLKGDWDGRVVPAYRDPLHWYESGKAYLGQLNEERVAARPKDRDFERSEIQGGLLKPQGSREEPVQHGALMLMTVTNAAAARTFIQDHLDVHYAEGEGGDPPDGYFRTIGFTADGLRRIGLETCLIDHFPQEFREGMEMRSGLVGDMRENHPRNWTLPPRGGLRASNEPDAPAKRPPVELSEVDFVIQVRTSNDDRDGLIAELRRLEALAADGASLQACQMMRSLYDDGQGISRDHFGFHDGVSQPKAIPGIDDTYRRQADEVRLGELLLGYRNDRSDFAPAPFGPDFPGWRQKQREDALAYQFNGSFMVIRKLEQHVATFESFIAAETARINCAHPGLAEPMTPDRLKAKLIGRYADGRPLIPTADGSLNNFTYEADDKGEKCPFAAHIRRANPRNSFQGRPAPRLVRRGMSFDESEAGGGKGLVFMAYNASIAEQYETIQRWINGGNSTDVAAGHNDPVMGVAPPIGVLDKAERVFRFVEGTEVVRVRMPKSFVSLHWGLYLFIPSRTALSRLCGLLGGYRPIEETFELQGRQIIERMDKIGDADTLGQEWKRLLEDFDAKDPAERNISPDVWAAIRYYKGGAIKIPGGVPPVTDWNAAPPKDQPMILCASYRNVLGVLSNWKTYSTEEQLRRIESNSGPIFVTQQPDDHYKAAGLQGKYRYRDESEKTNAILMGYDQNSGFQAGYAAGQEVLAAIRAAATASGRDYYKLELRRQYVLPSLGNLCRLWYGLPDGKHMHFGGWLWEGPDNRAPPGPRCPGDFLSPSRNAFYPRPSDTVAQFADVQGKAILAGSLGFVVEQRALDNGASTGSVARQMFLAIDENEVLARNLIGTMVGAIPPMDGNLRGILLEWFNERTLWRHQAALQRAFGGAPASTDPAKACALLLGPVSQAMCKRPAPDLLYRTATEAAVLPANDGNSDNDISVKERDIVVVSLVSAAQRSLHQTSDGDVSIVFGGKRKAPYQSAVDDIEHPVHACPAREMAMGAIMGIMAALLDAGRIQAMPASLIARISDWP